MAKHRTIKICGRDYRFGFDSNRKGARFGCNSADGDGSIVIGTRNRALKDMAARVMHEVMECVATEDQKRFYNYRSNSNDPDYIFVFDHDYLCGYTDKIIDGIISSGFFKVVDGRPEIKKTKRNKKKA